MSIALSAAAGDRLTPEKLWAMGRMGGVATDGSKIAYTLTHYSVAKNNSHTCLWLINTDGSNAKNLTGTAASMLEPSFLPDGRIAYIQKGNLFLMSADGKKRVQLSDGGDIEGYKFSPDASKVIVIRQVPYTASIEATPEDLPLTTGMVINDLNYKHWDHYVREIPHIFLCDVVKGKLANEKDLLNGEPYECPMLPFGGTEQFAWNNDGTQIAYTCRKKTGVDYAISTDSDIYLYDVATGKTVNLLKPEGYTAPKVEADLSLEKQGVNSGKGLFTGYDTNPSFSPDGTKLAWLSRERDGYEADQQHICVMDLKSRKVSNLTSSFDSEVDEFAWANDSYIYYIGLWHGRMEVYRASLDGVVARIATGDYDYTGLCVTPDRLFCKRHSISAPDDLYCIGTNAELLGSAPSVQPKAITAVNDSILSKLDFGEVRERIVKTQDGHDMLCWEILPPNFNPAKRYPALLFCEGGPQSPVSQFWSYRWNFQIMAANDYIIIAPNRRGLPGFGRQWLEEISGDYTGRCMQDYKDAIDDLAREPYVDSDRLGCVGASFGGYSTYWLAGNHEGRFKCFIAHDGIFNTTAQYTETEEMWFENWDAGGAFWRVPQNTYYTQSPHLYVDRWDAPILCIHGEKDYRILASQGQSAFMAARMRGIPAQLLLFPDENHWVLKPQNGILWQRTFFNWLDKWLKK